MLETAKAKILELRDEMMNFPELGLTHQNMEFIAKLRADWIESLTGLLGDIAEADQDWEDHECITDEMDATAWLENNPESADLATVPTDVCVDLWRQRKICVNEIGSITLGKLHDRLR